MDDSTPIAPHHHAVQFYENDNSLFTTVAGFLSQGLVEQQPAIIIATAEHARPILEHLAGRLIDIEKARSVGDLVVLDAQETLSLFMVDGQPDPRKFEASVGGLIAELVEKRSSRTLIRAYGEMVDVLWRQGQETAAIHLELLWNRLAGQYGFALLCGYAMGNFYKQTSLFEEVCRQHTHILPTMESASLAAPKSDLLH
jgi:hypothetical protein